jgi:uncharacterized Tic20 family protein
MSEAGDPTQPAGQTQPGWYPDPTSGGQLRWWDGQAWGQFQAGAAPAGPVGATAPDGATTSDPKQMAMWAHYSGAILLGITCWLGWVGPLIIMLTQGQNDPFVKDQATEALNFQITVAIAAVISSVLVAVIIGFVLLPLVWIGGIVLGVMGGMAASRGEWYRYPFAIRLVKA